MSTCLLRCPGYCLSLCPALRQAGRRLNLLLSALWLQTLAQTQSWAPTFLSCQKPHCGRYDVRDQEGHPR